jgi:Ca-activated chloride channel family protein
MTFLQTVQWEHPEFLWGLALLPLLAYLLAHEGWRQRRLIQRWSQAPVVRRRSRYPGLRTGLQRALCLLGGVAFAVLGFASPLLPGVSLEPAWQRVAIGLLLDVSPSMRAPAEPQMPGGPSRLEVLKQAVQDLLEHLPGGVRVGVIAFAGVSVAVVPEPTADHQAISAKIRRLDPTFIANPGTNLAAAVQQGLDLFADIRLEAQPDTVSLMLLSDGDTIVTAVLRQTLEHMPIPIFTLGIGALQPVRVAASSSRAGVPGRRQGQTFTTAVNASVLRLIADQTGGQYYPVAQHAALTRRLLALIDQYGQQVAEPVRRPRAARRGLFFAAFCAILLYQFQTRSGRVRQTAKGDATLL